MQVLLTSTPSITNQLNYKQYEKHLKKVYIVSLLDVYFSMDKCMNKAINT